MCCPRISTEVETSNNLKILCVMALVNIIWIVVSNLGTIHGCFANKESAERYIGSSISMTSKPFDVYDYERKGNHCNLKNANCVIFDVSNSALQHNSKLVDNMCMSYRHDFGLMAEQDKQALRFECKEWLRAYENNREHCC